MCENIYIYNFKTYSMSLHKRIRASFFLSKYQAVELLGHIKLGFKCLCETFPCRTSKASHYR